MSTVLVIHHAGGGSQPRQRGNALDAAESKEGGGFELRRAVVAGNSIGGYVALDLASKRPDLVLANNVQLRTIM